MDTLNVTIVSLHSLIFCNDLCTIQRFIHSPQLPKNSLYSGHSYVSDRVNVVKIQVRSSDKLTHSGGPNPTLPTLPWSIEATYSRETFGNFALLQLSDQSQ